MKKATEINLNRKRNQKASPKKGKSGKKGSGLKIDVCLWFTVTLRDTQMTNPTYGKRHVLHRKSG